MLMDGIDIQDVHDGLSKLVVDFSVSLAEFNRAMERMFSSMI